MCGVSGWVSFERDLAGQRAVVAEMTETMACRGPDARGVWIERHAALGHRRLSVIDIEGGTQPMSVDTGQGSVVLVYSGEAYNFTELRADLRGRGHAFRTASDTEVVLRGYLEWGEAVADRLNGMYAFAIWDARVERLVLIRDRMGIKPLYFHPTGDGVLFGSEPKVILANPLARRVVDLDGLREMFSFTKTPGHAVWAGMREVRPGTVVTVDRAGVRERTYWKLESREHTDDRDTTVARVRELLADIVRRQLVADVPQCVLLSGGLDSSALTALAAQRLAEPVRSFSVDFTGRTANRDSDTPHAHEVARHVDAEHSDIVLDHRALADPEVRRAVLTARDVPSGQGDLDASLYLLFRAIREHSTVALSGECADEVFGGYRWFHDPDVPRVEMFPWLIPRRPTSPGRPAAAAPAGTPLGRELMSRLDLLPYLQDRYAEAVAEVEPLPGEDEHERRMRTVCHLHLTRFVQLLLDRKDRLSMAVGLEVRVPFCDHRLIEYVYNVPWPERTFDGREKSLLRAAVADLLPGTVLNRAKSPYPSTTDPLYPAALQQQAKELLAERDHPVFGLVDRDWLGQAVQMDPAGMPQVVRAGLEGDLDLAAWLDIHRPELRLS
jgi:asparagine synthase (glutamine-hydrolysing)